MSVVTRVTVGWFIGSLLVAAAGTAQYEPALQYQRRGDRVEGLRLIPVAGLDVELMSARIDTAAPDTPSASARAWAETVRARFFLPDGAPLHLYLTVRQLRSQSTYYWLNYPDPPEREQSWKVGDMNEYAWLTSTVLGQLKNVRMEDLGAVMRVGQPGPARVERVLPVDLSDLGPAQAATRYRFSFKTNGRARVTADVYSDADKKPLYTKPGTWEQAGSPITVMWDAPPAEGWYRIVLSGYFESNAPVDKVVEFYHRPRLGRVGGPR